MADDNSSFISEKVKDRIIIGLIGAVIGTGIGGGAGYFRVDKFTGSEGKDHNARITALEKAFYALPPDWLKDKVSENHIKIKHIERLLIKMEKEHSWYFGTHNKGDKNQ